jgi:hypothetical protein
MDEDDDYAEDNIKLGEEGNNCSAVNKKNAFIDNFCCSRTSIFGQRQ